MKILVLGANGMLGYSIFTELSVNKSIEVYGSVKSIKKVKNYFPEKLIGKLIGGIDAEYIETVKNMLLKIKPDIVINCIGIVKQSSMSQDISLQIYINALFPHKLADLCSKLNIRLIHFSTDCVFSGKQGQYTELDPSDADDIYGKTKYLGEVIDGNCITIRTSILGHGLNSHYSLVDWLLLQYQPIKGYTKVIFSGLPAIEFAKIISEFIIPNENLHGLYHVSSDPISKYQLLKYICEIYKKKLTIKPYDKIICDRSLISEKFRNETSYTSPLWPSLIRKMYNQYQSSQHFVRFQ